MTELPQWYIELCNVLLEVRHAATKNCLSHKCSKLMGFVKALVSLNVIKETERQLIFTLLRNACVYANLDISDHTNKFNRHYQDGIDAYFDKKSQSENPYQVKSKAHELWDAGYRYARLVP